jgi:hypothetical protein
LSDALKKLNRISSFAGVIAKIIMAVLAIATVVAVIILIVTFTDPNLLTDPGRWGNITVTAPATIDQIRAAALAALVVIAFAEAIMYYVDRLFTNIRENNTPFTDENAKNLRIMAFLILAAVLVMAATGAILAYAFGTGSDIYIGANPFSLLVAFMVYVLSLIFSHGATLQKESDETL